MSAPGRAREHPLFRIRVDSFRVRAATAAAILVGLAALLSQSNSHSLPTASDAKPAVAPVSFVDDLAADRERARQDRASRDAARVAAEAQIAVATELATTPARPAEERSQPTRRAQPPAPQQPTRQPAAAPPSNGSRASVVVAFALAQVGKRYVWNTAGPSTYDCSGLTMAAFARVGIYLAHQSGAQAGAGQPVSRAQWLPGDLLVWSGHVAVYIGGGQMVAAANPGKGVVRQPVYGSPQGRRLV